MQHTPIYLYMFLFLRPQGACIHTSINLFCYFQLHGTWKFIDVVFPGNAIARTLENKTNLVFRFPGHGSPPKKNNAENTNFTIKRSMVKLTRRAC